MGQLVWCAVLSDTLLGLKLLAPTVACRLRIRVHRSKIWQVAVALQATTSRRLFASHTRNHWSKPASTES
jgi:hypothetical protein